MTKQATDPGPNTFSRVDCPCCQELKHYIELAAKYDDRRFAALERSKLEEHIQSYHRRGGQS